MRNGSPHDLLAIGLLGGLLHGTFRGTFEQPGRQNPGDRPVRAENGKFVVMPLNLAHG